MKLFPKNPVDGDEVIDSYGIKHQYDKQLDTWVRIGYVEVFQEVSEDNDGVVNPSLFNTLDRLEPSNYVGLKLSNTFNGSQNAYFYYLYSSDGTIKFSFDNIVLPGDPITKRVRVEINKQALISKLRKLDCVGTKGTQGDKGDPGRDGLNAGPEPVYQTSVVDGVVTIGEITVNTPIDTNVSIRLSNGLTEVIEYVITTTGEFIASTVIDGYTLDNAEVTFVDNKLNGTFTVTGDLEGDWTYRARQIGPQGVSGEDGTQFLDINNIEVQNENLVSNTVFHTLFKLGTDIALMSKQIGDNVVVTGLIQSNPDDFKFKLETTPLMGLTDTGVDAKEIVLFNWPGFNCPAPDLNLPEWTPTTACPDYRLWNVNNLDWASGHPDKPWATEEFPFNILIDPEPENDSCCKEDFFVCPNAGDNPCILLLFLLMVILNSHGEMGF
jgi:hypothetical protein